MPNLKLSYIKSIATAAAVAFLVLFACIQSTPAYAAEDSTIFASGSGTQADPYVIANASQLEAFRDDVNKANTYEGKFITLSEDIDISGQQWTPIGSAKRQGSGLAAGSNSFAGTFDGAGHTITGLTITPSGTQTIDADYALGLFGAVMGGTVENLTLEDVNIRCSLGALAGGAVGLLSDNGLVSGIKVSGSVSAKQGVGGVVGRMTIKGTIENCENSATVTGTTGTGNVGGIVGAAYYTPEGAYMAINGCVNNGAVSGTNDVGGIVGLCCAFVSGCTNNGEVTSTSYATGGIAGEVKNYGGVSHSTNAATISNTSTEKPYATGGIVGWVRYNGTAPDYALSAPAVIANNINSGDIKTESSIGVGGIVGVLYSAGTVTGNENTAAVLSGTQFIGGIVGNLQDQGATSLPQGITEGATVENNVSTTSMSAMTGTLADPIAYNNDAAIFEVHYNGDAWVASDESTGDMRYASLAHAVESAVDGDTVNLLADAEGVGMIGPRPNDDVTIELNGHSIGFDATGGITADGDTITIEGDGNMYAEDEKGNIIPAASLLRTVKGADGTEGKILLKGGTYPTDVTQYVAPGYELTTLAQPNGYDNQYEVNVAPAQTPGTTTPDDSFGGNASGEDNADQVPAGRHVVVGQPLLTSSTTPSAPSAASLTQASDSFGMLLIPIGSVGAAMLVALAIFGIQMALRRKAD